MKNAIYINCWSEPWIKVAHKLEYEYGIHPVYWIGYSSYTSSDKGDKLIPLEFQNIKYADYLESWMAHFPINILDNYPKHYLDVDFLKKHAEHELQAIKMMERVDPDRYSFNFMERQRHYRNMIKQWMTVIEDVKPDVVISTGIPHRLYDYVLYWLCQDYHIPFLTIVNTQFSGRFFFTKNDFYSLGNKFVNDWHKYEQKPDLIDTIPTDIFERFTKVKGDYQNAAPFYMKSKQNEVVFESSIRIILKYIKRTIKNKYSFKNLFIKGDKHAVGFQYFCKNKNMKYEQSYYSGIKSLLIYIKNKNYKKRLLSYYESLCTEPNYSVPYVCHFLHYQPEATTSPGGDIFVDQNLCIELLLKNLPQNYYIYVKEHKHQFLQNRPGHSCRMKDLYDDFLKNPRVKLISTNINTFELIDHSKAVSTITGTVGWEAMVRQKPVFAFGLCWYENYSKGVLRITDECSAKKMLHLIENYKYDEHSLLAYLASVGKNTALAYYFKEAFRKELKLTEDECVNNIVNAIVEHLN